MIMFNKKFNAQQVFLKITSQFLFYNHELTKNCIQAYECGLVTEVIDEANFEAEAMAQVKELSNLAIRSMEVSKALVQGRDSRNIIDQSSSREDRPMTKKRYVTYRM